MSSVERIDNPKIGVQYENLSVEGEVLVGNRAIPSLLNATLSSIEGVLGSFCGCPSKRRKIEILKNLNGIINPSRMTLLLGPPGSGKTTFLQTLAGKLNKDLSASGKVTYNGHEPSVSLPKRTCAFVGQHDLLLGQMTVRETFDFSARFQGIGTRHETFVELSRREKEEVIFKPYPKINALPSQETCFVTNYLLKKLKLENCANTVIGDAMRRGISGGEKKRVTIGETLAGPAKVLFLDEISNGLDSCTTFQICQFMSQMVLISDMTIIVSLLQPTPETFDLFDDIILISEGQIVYQGPRENALEFFERAGFKRPERKEIAEFLQEVTSKKDQEQYWFRRDRDYKYVSVQDFVEAFKSFENERKLDALGEKSRATLLNNKVYRTSGWDSLKVCFSREWLLTKRNAPVIAFKIVLIVITSMIAMSTFFRTEMPSGSVRDGRKFMGAIYFGVITAVFNGMVEIVVIVLRLPVFYKQRDSFFYPAWAFALPISILRIPLSFIESGLWVVLTYYTIGFAPDASRFFKQFLAYFGIYQMSISLSLLIAAVGRTQMLVNILGPVAVAIIICLGGIVITKNEIKPWLSWSCYLSPLMYGQSAVAMNEFLDKRWSLPSPVLNGSIGQNTVGKFILKSIDVPTQEHWFWVCIGALFAFSIIFNILFAVALTYLNPIRDSRIFVTDFEEEKGEKKPSSREITEATKHAPKRGPLLSIQPISLEFNHINYFVKTPPELKRHGSRGDRIQLLNNVCGSFRSGKLTAIVGVTGAGKTTLMDILSGRKTGGYIEGNITVSGYPKNQETFARICGYCEQNDIHSPNVTVYESLVYSAWLRLPKDIDANTVQMFVEEIMESLELNTIREAIVGLPGINGLSTEQRKRLTIAVELVANPSIIFMDEPTSGLDSKSASIVMRTIRRTVDAGRTVVCTIHQPSIDIFEAFDELLLMKLGGQVIYAGPLGHHSQKLIEYFEGIPGIPKIQDGDNPATWVLEVTDPLIEDRLNINLAKVYTDSLLYQRNQELIEQLTPEPNTDIHFRTKHSQPFSVQFRACFWKQRLSYWRNSLYVTSRFSMAIMVGSLLGLVFWNKGQNINKQKDLMNLLGAMYAAVGFLGANNASSVQTIITVERTVFYREKAAGMYSALAYAMAQAGIEMICTAIQSLVFALILFSMFGLEWTVLKFFWFFYYVSTFMTYFVLFGMMLVAITPGIEISLTIMTFLNRLWNLYSGFFILRTEIPVWGRWYYWASPMGWTVYGLVMSQVGNEDLDLNVLGSTVRLKIFLKETFGFEYDFIHVVALAHVGWVLLFLFVFIWGIKYLNFQKR